MRENIAKVYTKAFLKVIDSKELSSCFDKLSIFENLFSNNTKFQTILNSPYVKIENKVNLVLSILDTKQQNLINLIKLLGEKKRLNLIPLISKELDRVISKNSNSYNGVLYSGSKLDSKIAVTLEKKLSDSSKNKINLVQKIREEDGVVVSSDTLGIEIGFSKNKMKSQLIEHIIKAI
jgi:F-type H+-transporting ATPase subunit delta